MEPWRAFVYAISTFFNMVIIHSGLYLQFGKPTNLNRTLIYTIACLFLIIGATIFVGMPIVIMLSNLVSIFLLVTCYSGAKLRYKIVAPLIMYVLFVMMEGMGIIISTTFNIDNEQAALIIRHIVIKVIALAVLLMISRFKQIKNGHEHFSLANTAILLAIPLFSIIIIILNAYDIETRIYQSLFTILFLALLNAMVYYLYNTLSNFYIELSKAQIIDQQNQYNIQQIGEINKHQERIQLLQHDLKNYLLSIRSYLHNNAYETAIAEIDKIIDAKLVDKTYCNTGNMAIDSILNYKLQELEVYAPNIELKTEIPSKIGFEDYDISMILGNLIDNVNDAFLRLSSDSEKVFKCTILFKPGALKILVENTFDGIVEKKGARLLSRKHDKKNHGLGLLSIESAVNKYFGVIEFTHTKDTFIIEIILFEDVNLIQ